MSHFKLSDETKTIVRFLREIEKGNRITYAELSRSTGLKLTTNSPKLLYARRILQRDHNAVWVPVRPGIGIQRLTDAEIAERLPSWFLSGARNKLRRGKGQSSVVEIKQLDKDEQIRFAVDNVQLELATQSLSKAARNKLEKVSRGSSNDMPSFTAVEWAISLSPRTGRS